MPKRQEEVQRRATAVRLQVLSPPQNRPVSLRTEIENVHFRSLGLFVKPPGTSVVTIRPDFGVVRGHFFRQSEQNW